MNPLSTSVGTKAYNLQRLQSEFDLFVPRFMAIEWDEIIQSYPALASRLETPINDYLAGTLTAAAMRKKITKLLSYAILNKVAVSDLYKTIGTQGWAKVSFRTSAANEDGAEHSFAGQYESYVDIKFTQAAIKKYAILCFESMVSERVIGYAKAKGMPSFSIGGSLIIQEMFYGKTSGVAFSEDGLGNVTIAAGNSWKNTIVDGDEAEITTLAKQDLAGKKPRGFKQQLAVAAIRIEQAIGGPVDIEWSYNGKTLAFLQFRPQTTDTTANTLTWDSTNISENYPGVTLPLTYSFIRTLYANVYPSFFLMMGTPQKTLAKKAPVFDNMLGYIDGHIYYRISNWYEVVKLIPGKRNQLYFEAMLNPVQAKGKSTIRTPLDIGSVVAMIRFSWLLLNSQRYSRGFKRTIQTKLEAYSTYQWASMQPTATVSAIKEVRRELLSLWAVPILNDIRVMIFHGILKTVFFGKSHQESYLNYLAGLTDRASIAPLEALKKLGQATSALLEKENVSTLKRLQKTTSWDEAAAGARAYIHNFKARTPDELKLENTRLSDDPLSILTIALNAKDQPLRAEPTPVIYPAHLSPLLRPALWYIAKQTRSAIDWRERFRFNRAQVFDVARQAYAAVGVQFAKEGVLKSARDIFWLSEQEIDENANGHAWDYSAKKLVAQRKRLFKGYASSSVSTGLMGHGTVAPLHLSAVEKETNGKAKTGGNGVAPGKLTAPVIVAKTFDPNLDVRGKILVVSHIDPGWTVLFTQAAGVITERGNALSHAAIIAREIGIPAIVAVPNITSILTTGDTITIDGILGTIKKHEK